MTDLWLRYFWILALIAAGFAVRKTFPAFGGGQRLAFLATSVLFPAYVFWAVAWLDPETLSFSTGIRIAAAVFAIASATYFGYRALFGNPYAFVAASRNYRSLGVPLLYFRFYDSILQEVAVFAVLGMAVFESAASVRGASWGKGNGRSFALAFFSAFVLGSAIFWGTSEGYFPSSAASLASLFGKGLAGYAYSVVSLFFIGYAVAPSFDFRKWRNGFRQSWPILLSQTVVWPAAVSLGLLADAAFGGFVTGWVSEIAQAFFVLSFMPASVTSAAVCARTGSYSPAWWVAASTGLFLLYCPFLLGSASSKFP